MKNKNHNNEMQIGYNLRISFICRLDEVQLINVICLRLQQ